MSNTTAYRIWQDHLSKKSQIIIGLVVLSSIILGVFLGIIEYLVLAWVCIISVFLTSFLLINFSDPLCLRNLIAGLGIISVIRIGWIVATGGVDRWGGFVFGSDGLGTFRPLLVIILFTLVGSVGYLVGNNRSNFFANQSFNKIFFGHSVTGYAVFIILLIGVVSNIQILGSLGGISGFTRLLLTNELDYDYIRGQSSVINLTSNFDIAGAVIILVLATSRKERIRATIIGSFVFFLHIWSGSRTELLPILLGFGFLAVNNHENSMKRWIVIGIFSYLIMNIVLIGRIHFSGAFLDQFMQNPFQVFRSETQLGLGGSIDAFIRVINMEPPVGVRFWSFAPWYSSLIYLIPRFIFPGKPVYIPIGKIVKAKYILGSASILDSGVAPTIMSTLYLNAGLLGVIIGSLVIGLLLGKIDSLFKPKATKFSPIFQIIIWFATFILLRTGDLVAAVSQSLSMFLGIGVVLFASILLRKKSIAGPR